MVHYELGASNQSLEGPLHAGDLLRGIGVEM